jgi:hypothetical protein
VCSSDLVILDGFRQRTVLTVDSIKQRTMT